MEYRSPGHFRKIEDFRSYYSGLNEAFDCAVELGGAHGPLADPIDLPGIEKSPRNRFAIHPMEGWDGGADGTPSVHTRRRWRNFGRSGAKLIWGGEAFAVRADGRANPNQLYFNPDVDVVTMLRSLREEVVTGHTEANRDTDDLCIGLQLTHSGRYARPQGDAAPLCAYHHPALDERLGGAGAVTVLSDDELKRIRDQFVRSAKAAHEAGFDFVDVKCCHGYLLHELLSARDRSGAYGGSLENRARLALEIVDGIRNTSPSLGIGVRLSVTDCVPHRANPETHVGEPDPVEHFGFGMRTSEPAAIDLTEPFEFIRMLNARGVRLINATLGSPYYCAHVQRPAAYPPSDGYRPPEDPLFGVQRHLGVVRQCKAAFPETVFVGTGYSYLQEWLGHVAEFEVGNGHVDFVGLGRMVLSYPDLPADLLAGKPLVKRRICRTFSDCTTGPRNGFISGCFPLDPYYKNMDIANEIKAIKKGLESA